MGWWIIVTCVLQILKRNYILCMVHMSRSRNSLKLNEINEKEAVDLFDIFVEYLFKSQSAKYNFQIQCFD